MSKSIDRRTFIRSLAAGTGSMLLGVWLTSCTNDDETAPTTRPPTSTTSSLPTTTAGIAGDPTAQWDAHLLLRIDGDETVTITVPKSEMGQGIRTSLAMIVAEELDADWSKVRVTTAGAEGSYGDQVTGGSLSVSTRFDSMRRVGATARHMLIAAAAAEWGIDTTDCATEPGVVVERSGIRRVGYGSLAGRAAGIEPPPASEVELKDPRSFRLIGTAVGAVDAIDIVTGAAIYGSDVVLRDMAFGAIARSPVFGGRAAEYDDSATRAIPGVLDVVEVSTGVAVVAENTWAAVQGRDALQVTWDNRGNDALDDASIRRSLLDRLEPVVLESDEITADYTFPFFAHGSVEPLTCVADASVDHCEVWAATQHPQLAQAVAGRGSSLAADQVTLHVPLIGGGFGRRLDQDFVEEAAELSAATSRPIKLFWSRNDDLQHDRYHPASICRGVGNPAEPAQLRLDMQLAWNDGVPTGNWRSVTNAPEAFAHECFVDELAHAAGADPYEYRRELLTEQDLATLDLAAEAAGWGDSLPPGRGRGIAHHSMWGVTPTTIVAEVSTDDGTIQVHRIVCALDCGIVVNPDTVAAQIEGAVAFALSAALGGGVTIAGGGVAETNFHDSPILRFDEMPEVEVHTVSSTGSPSGIGEAGVPPVPPAIANAVFAASGSRLRELPLRLP